MNAKEYKDIIFKKPCFYLYLSYYIKHKLTLKDSFRQDYTNIKEIQVSVFNTFLLNKFS